ncbi:MAG: hypothetical protein N4A38_00070 [Candidatus Gracilibacteria bacterium]|nr:hypothetical protein [Candidatus Gracilibacteria bacterium]
MKQNRTGYGIQNITSKSFNKRHYISDSGENTYVYQGLVKGFSDVIELLLIEQGNLPPHYRVCSKIPDHNGHTIGTSIHMHPVIIKETQDKIIVQIVTIIHETKGQVNKIINLKKLKKEETETMDKSGLEKKEVDSILEGYSYDFPFESGTNFVFNIEKNIEN